MAPFNRSDTEILELSAANIVAVRDSAPPVRQAFSETLNSVSGVNAPTLIWLSTYSTVISLDKEAGVICWSSFDARRTVPDSASIMKICLALLWKAAFCSIGCDAASADEPISEKTRINDKITRKASLMIFRSLCIPTAFTFSHNNYLIFARLWKDDRIASGVNVLLLCNTASNGLEEVSTLSCA